jgi:hypothetical protein
MPAYHSTLDIGDAYVEVGSVVRDRSSQSQDFKIAAYGVRLSRASQSQSSPAQTDARYHKARLVRTSGKLSLEDRA